MNRVPSGSRAFSAVPGAAAARDTEERAFVLRLWARCGQPDGPLETALGRLQPTCCNKTAASGIAAHHAANIFPEHF